jgi:hypothetical protein
MFFRPKHLELEVLTREGGRSEAMAGETRNPPPASKNPRYQPVLNVPRGEERKSPKQQAKEPEMNQFSRHVPIFL